MPSRSNRIKAFYTFLHVCVDFMKHILTPTHMYTYEFMCLFCYQENQTLPDRIFVFRDGVGDGQMATVADYEVPQISSCFSMFGECEGGVGEGVCG